MTMSDTEESSTSTEFNFEAWLVELKIPRKVLHQEELVMTDSFVLIGESDLKGLSLPLGSVKIISQEISK